MASPDDNKPYTLEQLSEAMADLKYAESEFKEHQNRANAARRALESHERDMAKADEEVQRRRVKVKKILANLEKL
jgi:septal ring factor EnvC (AmiA/AmiB activator)